MKAVLLIDFGSTYTKLTAVDLDTETVLGTAASYTTIETDISDGLTKGLKLLEEKTGKLDYAETYACSSAAGGLRMIASDKGRVIAAGWSGKVKTASTMACIVLMFLPIPAVVNTICVWVIALTTLYSGVEYFVQNKDVISSM